MDRLSGILDKEEQRYIKERDELLKALDTLPKGSLFVRTLHNKQYCYLRYWDNHKSVTRYAGTVKEESRLRREIEHRKTLELRVEELDDLLRRVRKMKQIK